MRRKVVMTLTSEPMPTERWWLQSADPGPSFGTPATASLGIDN